MGLLSRERIRSPPSLSSHLSSSLMGVFSRDYGTCSVVLTYQLPSLKHNQLSSQCIGQKRILVRVLYSEIVSMLPHGMHQGKVIVYIAAQIFHLGRRLYMYLNNTQTTDNHDGNHDYVGLVQAYIVLYNAPNLIPRTSPKKSGNETNTIP